MNYGNEDYWIVKLSATGAIQWQKSYGGSGYDAPLSIQQTTDSGYIVAGQTNSFDGDVTGHRGTAGNHDYWVIKLSSTGVLMWEKTLGGSADDEGFSIQQTVDGGYIVVGFTQSADGDVARNHGGNDVWAVKLFSDGNIQWQNSIGGTGNDGAWSVRQTIDSGYVLAGWIWSNDSDVSGNHGGQDYWVVKLSAAGDIGWQKCLGGSRNEVAQSIDIAADGYIVAGSSRSNDSDVTGNHGYDDYWIVKLKDTSATTLGVIKSFVSNDIAIAPNPTAGSFSVTGVDAPTIRVYNSVGQIVKEAIHENDISIASYPAGLYLVRVFDKHGWLIKQEKIVKSQ